MPGVSNVDSSDVDESCGEEESSEEDIEEEGESEESVEQPTLNVVERQTRATAGKNTKIREGKAAEDDATFWGHADFAERSSDSDFGVSGSELEKNNDTSDSDFDYEEGRDSPLEGPGKVAAEREAEEEERRRKPKKSFIPVPRRQAPKAKQKPHVLRTRVLGKMPARPARSIRASTRHQTAQVEERAVSREECPRALKKVRLVPSLSQLQRLEQAKVTETQNLNELQAMRNWEDETRQQMRRGLRRKRHQGPRTRSVSRRLSNGRIFNFVEFIDCDLPDFLQGGKPTAPPQKPRCAVTGRLARYRDPTSGLPFATAASFAKLPALAKAAGKPSGEARATTRD